MPDFTLPPKNLDSPFADMAGHHVAIRTTSLEEAKDFYVGKLVSCFLAAAAVA
jgi:glyoxylase I family protein